MRKLVRVIFAVTLLLHTTPALAQPTLGYSQDSVLSPPVPGVRVGGDEPQRPIDGSVSPVLKGIVGSVMVIGGIVLALNGFKKTYKEIFEETFIQVDVSQPGLDISNWFWTKEQIITWWADSQGTVSNTGNVPLKNVKIIRAYYDGAGQLIAQDFSFLDVYWLDPLPVGAQDSWSYFNGGWIVEPMTASIRAEYTYDPIYVQQSTGFQSAGREYTGRKDATMGWLGVVTAGVGAYLLYDAVYRGSKLHAALDQRGIDFILASNILAGYGGVEIRKVF